MLKEWALNYFKFRSSFDKFKVVDKGKYLELDYAESKNYVYFNENLSDFKLKAGIFVTKNSLKNRDYLVKNWSTFLIKGLRIFFVNKNKTKWAINPLVHDRIVDKKNLKKSISSLAND